MDAPSRRGIFTSESTRSMPCCSITSRASCPSTAWRTVYPSSSRRMAISSRITGSSSTTRTVGINSFVSSRRSAGSSMLSSRPVTTGPGSPGDRQAAEKRTLGSERDRLLTRCGRRHYLPRRGRATIPALGCQPCVHGGLKQPRQNLLSVEKFFGHHPRGSAVLVVACFHRVDRPERLLERHKRKDALARVQPFGESSFLGDHRTTTTDSLSSFIATRSYGRTAKSRMF